MEPDLSMGLMQMCPPQYTEKEFQELLVAWLKSVLAEYDADPLGFTQRYIARRYGSRSIWSTGDYKPYEQ